MSVPKRNKSKLENLVAHPGTIVGDPDDIINTRLWFERCKFSEDFLESREQPPQQERDDSFE